MLALQNCWVGGCGAYTGEVAADMVADCLAPTPWVILGHSERRHLPELRESDETVAKKTKYAVEKGLQVILCIGELLEEREANRTQEVNERQLEAVRAVLSPDAWDRIVIAYEPVWAIGTGKVATPEQAQETHAAVRQWLIAETRRYSWVWARREARSPLRGRLSGAERRASGERALGHGNGLRRDFQLLGATAFPVIRIGLSDVGVFAGICVAQLRVSVSVALAGAGRLSVRGILGHVAGHVPCRQLAVAVGVCHGVCYRRLCRLDATAPSAGRVGHCGGGAVRLALRGAPGRIHRDAVLLDARDGRFCAHLGTLRRGHTGADGGGGFAAVWAVGRRPAEPAPLQRVLPAGTRPRHLRHRAVVFLPTEYDAQLPAHLSARRRVRFGGGARSVRATPVSSQRARR
eukprot:ctg_174.g110